MVRSNKHSWYETFLKNVTPSCTDRFRYALKYTKEKIIPLLKLDHSVSRCLDSPEILKFFFFHGFLRLIFLMSFDGFSDSTMAQPSKSRIPQLKNKLFIYSEMTFHRKTVLI